jgi:sterol O-acyltransferase
MAESTSIDAPYNGNTEYHSPRPRKPTRIDLLKPQLSDEVITKDGKLNETASGLSRYEQHRYKCTTPLIP